MIGRIVGTLLEKTPPYLLIDVNGIGYEVETSMNTFYALAEVGESTTLYTHLITREDAQLLYGFHDKRERSLFRLLIKVNGVGPKLAITVLSSITPDEFSLCVANNDVASLVRLPGVGKKTAERLIIEMRDKLANTILDSTVDAGSVAMDAGQQATQDAISALIALGYKPQEANRVIKQQANGKQSSEQLIRQALQSMVSK